MGRHKKYTDGSQTISAVISKEQAKQVSGWKNKSQRIAGVIAVLSCDVPFLTSQVELEKQEVKRAESNLQTAKLNLESAERMLQRAIDNVGNRESNRQLLLEKFTKRAETNPDLLTTRSRQNNLAWLTSTADLSLFGFATYEETLDWLYEQVR